MGQISIEVTFEVFCDDYLVKWGVKSHWVVSKSSMHFKFEEQCKTDGNSLTQ